MDENRNVRHCEAQSPEAISERCRTLRLLRTIYVLAMTRWNGHSEMKRSLLIGGVLVILGLNGCGEPVSPEEISCPSGICWDASRTSYLSVNDFPYLSSLQPKEIHGYRFQTTKGYTYSVMVKVPWSGSANTYVSPDHLIDPRNTRLVDYYSNDEITFTAEADTYYIAIEDLWRGSDYSVRIISYDENLEPLEGTIPLLANDYPVSFKVIPKETVRFMFNAWRGNDYTVKVRVTNGKTDTFLSLIPSVDQDVYDLVDWYSNDDIRFRATESGRYYIAIIDRGEITGSDFSIQVTSP